MRKSGYIHIAVAAEDTVSALAYRFRHLYIHNLFGTSDFREFSA